MKSISDVGRKSTLQVPSDKNAHGSRHSVVPILDHCIKKCQKTVEQKSINPCPVTVCVCVFYFLPKPYSLVLVLTADRCFAAGTRCYPSDYVRLCLCFAVFALILICTRVPFICFLLIDCIHSSMAVCLHPASAEKDAISAARSLSHIVYAVNSHHPSMARLCVSCIYIAVFYQNNINNIRWAARYPPVNNR